MKIIVFHNRRIMNNFSFSNITITMDYTCNNNKKHYLPWTNPPNANKIPNHSPALYPSLAPTHFSLSGKTLKQCLVRVLHSFSSCVYKYESVKQFASSTWKIYPSSKFIPLTWERYTHVKNGWLGRGWGRWVGRVTMNAKREPSLIF